MIGVLCPEVITVAYSGSVTVHSGRELFGISLGACEMYFWAPAVVTNVDPLSAFEFGNRKCCETEDHAE